MTDDHAILVRAGDVSDADAMLGLLDDAVGWLVPDGRAEQWGAEPFTARPEWVRRVRDWAADGWIRIAETGGRVVGAVALGPAPDYAPPATEPEVYVQTLVADRTHRGRGIGAALLARARAEAVCQGVRLVRLACWAGGDGALVRYYERAGFVARQRFRIGNWEGQILTQDC